MSYVLDQRNILCSKLSKTRTTGCKITKHRFCFASLVPPDILDYPTSTDMVIREGQNVTLRCAASGSPTPNVTWRREGGEPIPLGNGKECMYLVVVNIKI